MSAIKDALDKLDQAVSKLDTAMQHTEVQNGQGFSPQQTNILVREDGKVVDVDFIANRLDRAIDTVEYLLREEG